MKEDSERTVDGPNETYNRIARHLPDDARRAVSEYLPELEASVDNAVRAFGRGLATDIKERTTEELCAGCTLIDAALDGVRAVEEFTDEYKRAMKHFRRDRTRLRKSLRRLDRGVGQLKQIESNGKSLDRQLRTFDERVADFRRSTSEGEGLGSAADCLRAFYDGWEPSVKDISVAKDGEIMRALEKLREAVRGVGAVAVDDEQPGEVEQQEGVVMGAAEGPDEPARVEAARDHEAPLATAPADGTPKGDTDPAYCLTSLVDDLRCMAHKKLGEQACAASIKVQKAASKCDSILRRRDAALKDAREDLKATVLGIDSAKAAVAKTARRVTKAIEDGVAAAKLESFGLR